jgi:hypothetical protein
LKEAKKLKKRYKSIPLLITQLIDTLEENPFLGIPLGKGFFKIRIAVPEKNKGKSGGLRVISNVVLKVEEQEDQTLIYLTSIFDKSDKETISDKELQNILDQIDAINEDKAS